MKAQCTHSNTGLCKSCYEYEKKIAELEKANEDCYQELAWGPTGDTKARIKALEAKLKHTQDTFDKWRHIFMQDEVGCKEYAALEAKLEEYKNEDVVRVNRRIYEEMSGKYGLKRKQEIDRINELVAKLEEAQGDELGAFLLKKRLDEAEGRLEEAEKKYDDLVKDLGWFTCNDHREKITDLEKQLKSIVEGSDVERKGWQKMVAELEKKLKEKNE